MSMLLSLMLLATAEVPKADRPNVVLINVDDLGINDLGCYGRKDQSTPHLDGLAKQGMRFTSAYVAQPICSPSRAALMTGKHPARLHLTTFLPGRPDTQAQRLLHPTIRQQLPLEELTLGELFGKAGYRTGCIGKWHLGGKGFLPNDQGFDVVFTGRANTVPSATEGGKGEYELTRTAMQFVEENRERPFLLYLAHNTPHIPLAAKSELLEKNKNSFNPLYAAVIETLDDTIGLLLSKLDELKLNDRTIVIFISDNGGLHVPEGKEDPPTHNTPFRAGKGFVYEGGTRVPLLVRWPGKIKAGTVVHTPVVNTDLLPTLAELTGLAVPEGLDGQSFAPLLLGKGEPKPRPLFWHFPHYNNQGGRPAGAVREGEYKLVTHYDDDSVELYNLARDPGETTNLADKEPKRAQAMLQQLRDWRKAIHAQENKPNPNVDETLYRQLYVEVDVSKLQPDKTAAAMTPRLAAWRKLMNQVAAQPKKNKR